MTYRKGSNKNSNFCNRLQKKINVVFYTAKGITVLL